MIALLAEALLPPKELQNSGGTFYPWVVAGVSAIGWAASTLKLHYEKLKLQTEIKKLQAEAIKLAGDFLKSVSEVESAYSAACARCKEHSLRLIKLILDERTLKSINDERNDFGSAICMEAIPKLCELARWRCLDRSNDAGRLVEYIEKDLCPELMRLRGWIDTMNSPRFLNDYSASPLIIESRTLREISDLTRHIPKDRKDVVELLDETVGRFCDGAQPS